MFTVLLVYAIITGDGEKEGQQRPENFLPPVLNKEIPFLLKFAIPRFPMKNTTVFALCLIFAFIAFPGEGYSDSEHNKNTSAESSGKKERRKPMVLISTSLGDIKLELYEEQAPITVANFLSYVEEGFYDGTIFHRVINNFMIQGGGITADMKQKPAKAPIKNEADNGLKNDRGTIAMARTAAVDSATSQFFINHRDNAFLDHGARDFGYAVFGKVVEGIEVVDKIATVQTRPGDVPVETVSILSMKVVD